MLNLLSEAQLHADKLGRREGARKKWLYGV